MMALLAIGSCALALVPAALFTRNLALYRTLPAPVAKPSQCSVLIPARNEEMNIGDALRSVLRSEGLDFEVIVLDDGSSDRTPEIVRQFAAADPRVRLAAAAPLPAGWCGKASACAQLAALAREPILIFMDADVHVSRPDSLARLVGFLEESRAMLVSGVPCQITGSILERLIIPLIHFVLLGFLPLARMRASADPRFAAACGQILAVQGDAYRRVGGHAAIAHRIHDGIALARRFRSLGCQTDLFDGTDTFTCRMYRTAAETWNGFAKNAHEGLATPQLIVPSTLVLLGGQVFPLIALALAASPLAVVFAMVGVAAAFTPRVLAAVRFRQSILGALLHPLGLCFLVSIQWVSFFRLRIGRPAEWKGRHYAPTAAQS